MLSSYPSSTQRPAVHGSNIDTGPYWVMRAPLIAALSLLLSQSAVAGQVPVPSPSPYGRLPAGTMVAQFIRPEVKLLTLKPVLSQDVQGLRVIAGPVTRTFPAWRSISNPTFWPGLAVNDVTGDRHADLVVTLMTDEGTGVAVYDVRVVTLPNLREIAVAPPLPYLRAHVRFGAASLAFRGRVVRLPLPEGAGGPHHARIGDQVRWDVRGGHLMALVEVQKDWAFTGRLVVVYRSQAGQLVPASVTYDPSELK